MYSVGRISFGDDGSALTIISEAAPIGKFYDPLVNNETGILMQYTRLKDKNGTEIYEGDIVNVLAKIVSPNDAVGLRKIIYSSGEYALEALDTNYSRNVYPMGMYSSQADLGIIGNVYEKPELLKD